MLAINRQLAFAIGVTLAVQGLFTRARAQDYPSRAINVIVPFPAGGPSDVVARIVTEQMGRVLAQSMTIENVGGGVGLDREMRVAARVVTDLDVTVANPGDVPALTHACAGASSHEETVACERATVRYVVGRHAEVRWCDGRVEQIPLTEFDPLQENYLEYFRYLRGESPRPATTLADRLAPMIATRRPGDRSSDTPSSVASVAPA